MQEIHPNRKDPKMRLTRLGLLLPVFAFVVLAGALSSCGSSGSSSGTSSVSSAIPSEFQAPTSAPSDAKSGGHLTVLAEGDIDYMDPGAAYYQFTYQTTEATQRGLMGWEPGTTTDPTPDLADGPPDVSSDNKTITFHLKSGVKFSPPVNREVTSADVKYAIERSLIPGVANGYTASYLGSLEGFAQAQAAVKKNPSVAPNISGIETPDDSTIVFKLDKPEATAAIQALSLPISAPVPEEYAKKFDSQTPSNYGQYVVFTGPYMVQNDCVNSSGAVTNQNCSGKLTGYTPGKEIDLVRNPNWDSSTDFRPAYLDSITIQEGFADPTSASQKILTGSDQVSGDFSPSNTVIKDIVTGNKYSKDQLSGSPAGANRFIALNTSEPPFDDINVRKAVIAGTDRTALRNTRGGSLVGAVATHFIPPAISGFDEAGGYGTPKDPATGKPLDFYASPTGNMQLAEEYMKKAGFKSGKCEGSVCDITMVGDNTPPGSDTATVMKDQLGKLGFNVQLQQVEHTAMYTRFCSVVKSEPSVCPNVGWVKDFNDPQSMLQVPFSSTTISASPANNSNWAQLNDPTIDKAIEKGLTVPDSQRAQYWGQLDDQIMALAPVIMWDWDNELYVRSDDVNGVINLFNAEFDLSFTSVTNP
jgi:peptide/nickel transport system substrate-binding protein